MKPVNNVNRPKLCGNCTFPQNFRTRKLGEITVFYRGVFVLFNYNPMMCFTPWKLMENFGFEMFARDTETQY